MVLFFPHREWHCSFTTGCGILCQHSTHSLLYCGADLIWYHAGIDQCSWYHICSTSRESPYYCQEKQALYPGTWNLLLASNLYLCDEVMYIKCQCKGWYFLHFHRKNTVKAAKIHTKSCFLLFMMCLRVILLFICHTCALIAITLLGQFVLLFFSLLD